MPKRFDIEVTEEIINTATVRDSGHCMIADALRLSLPGATHISVDLQTIRWSLGDRRYISFTPRVAQESLIAFDQGNRDKIKPFLFRVSVVQSIKRRPSDWNEERSAKQRERRAADKVEAETGGRFLRRTGLAPNQVPWVDGGKAPPTAALASNTRGRRRAFGLRSLKY